MLRQYSIVRLAIWICECATASLAVWSADIASIDQINGPLFVIIVTGFVSGIGVLATSCLLAYTRDVPFRNEAEHRYYSPAYVVTAQCQLDLCTLVIAAITALSKWSSDPQFDELALVFIVVTVIFVIVDFCIFVWFCPSYVSPDENGDETYITLPQIVES